MMRDCPLPGSIALKHNTGDVVPQFGHLMLIIPRLIYTFIPPHGGTLG